jgi:hypothetical protein
VITLQAKSIFVDEEHDQAVVAVQTSLTFYRVAIRKDQLTVIGPGIEEDFNGGDLNIHHLEYEQQAICVVMQVEGR